MNTVLPHPAGLSRRAFLETLALAGAAASLPALSGGQTCDTPQAGPRRTLGRGEAALEVSPIGFGAMGMSYNRGPRKDPKAMARLLNQAADMGYILFDTAEVYGPHTNERLVGEALGARQRRGELAIATKFGHRIESGHHVHGELDSRPQTIRRVAEESLRRLRVECLDLFYQHRADPKVPCEEVAGTVAALIREGKVRRFGMCEVSAETVRRAHAVCPLTAVQSECHLMWRGPREKLFPTLCELGIGFVPYSPLNRGFLTGAITPETRFDPTNDNRGTLPRFTPEALRANAAIVEALRAFGEPYGATPAQVALGWLLAKAPWIVPIPGTTRLDHARENLATLNFRVPADAWARLERTVAALPIVGDRYDATQQRQVAQ